MAYLLLDGTGAYAQASDSAALDVAGDIELRVRVAADDWTSGGIQALVGKFASDPNRAYRLYLDGSGNMVFQTTPNGTFASRVQATSSAPSLTDGTAYWLRATLDVDNGSSQHVITFYKADDSETVPSSWTTISTHTGAGTTSIHPGSLDLNIGADAGSFFFTGKLYRVQILDGIGGTLVFDADFSDPTTWTFT